MNFRYMFYFVLWKAIVLLLVDVISGRNESQHVGILFENCNNDISMITEQNITMSDINVIPYVWKVGCNEYITLANYLCSVKDLELSYLIIIGSRDLLRFVDSMLQNSPIKKTISIPTNNELMISGFVQTKLQREICNNRAGGKQFWGLVVSMLPDIIDHWQWRSLYLYVDENFGLLEAKQVYEAFRPYQKVASIKLIKTTSQIEPVQFVKMLHRFDRGSREVKGVVIICGHRNTVEIIKESSKLGLFNRFYRWLFFDNGTQDALREFRLQFDNDVVLMRHSRNNTIMSSVFEALKNIDDFFKVTTTVSPLIGPRAKHRHEQNKCASESYTFSNPKVYNKNILGREYLPQDFHIEFNRVKRRAGFAIPSLIKIGEWTAASGFYNVKAQSFDFGGFSLQAVAIHCPPYVIVSRNSEGEYSFQGYLVDLLEALGRIMNFKFNITVPFDQTYGRCEGKICSGLIGALARKEADIGLANLSPTGSRIGLMDFSTISIDKSSLGILIRRPLKSDVNAIKAYLMPFSLDVAICVAFAIPLFGLLLHVTMDGGERIRHGQVIENEETHARTQIDKDNRSIGRCLFIAVQSFGQQGIDVVPQTPAGRCIFGIMWIFSLFVMSAYTANLISYFTATFISYPFKTLEDAYEKRYQIGFMKGTTYLDDIQGDNVSLLMKIWKKMEKQKFTTLVDNLDEGLERVRSERYVLLHESRILQYFAGIDCEFDIINEKYLSAPMTLVFQKNSQFKSPISQMLLKISESGLLERLKQRWWPPTYDCSIAAQSFSSVSLWGMTSIFGILGVGIALSSLLVLIEKGIVANKLRNRLKALTTALPDNLPSLQIPLP